MPLPAPAPGDGRPPQGIDIWLAFYDGINDPLHMAAMRELLSDAEREQEQRFHFEEDRKRYRVTRALVRTALSRYEQVPAERWEFSTNAYGRPEIASVHTHVEGLRFNVSHTRGLIVLAVSRHRQLGIDVELVNTRPHAPLGIADHFFAPAEVAALRATPPAEQGRRFLEYWTFKEAYVKARGMGLSIPLDKFTFQFPDERTVSLATSDELNDDGTRWAFRQFCPAPEYLLAVCAERLPHAECCFTFRTFIPYGAEAICELPCHKRSTM